MDTREERKPHPSISILRNHVRAGQGLGDASAVLFIDRSKEEVFHHSEKPCCEVQQGQRECAPGDLERKGRREMGNSLCLKAGKHIQLVCAYWLFYRRRYDLTGGSQDRPASPLGTW